MNELEASRLQINAVDKDLAALFEKRMRLVEQILAYKKQNGLPILDEAREARVIASNISNISDPVLQEYYVLFLRELMRISKAYQGRLMDGMKVAYCGVPGAFAYIAASKLFPDASPVSFPDFQSAYHACEQGVCDAAVLPVENSFAGDVGGVMDLAYSGSLHINMMAELDITQNLLGVKGAKLSDVRKVISHPQALAQCAAYISEKGFSVEEAGSTSDAARMVAETGDSSVAAVASVETASLYGLDVLERHINTAGANATRFAVFSRAGCMVADASAQDEHFILVFTVRNEAGALAKILNVIGSHGFNMSNLHSRPAAGMLWKHYFFAELEGSAGSENGQDLIRQLETVCDRLKLVGTYKTLHLGR